MEENFNKHLGS